MSDFDNALCLLKQSAQAAGKSFGLTGKLYISKSGWLLLSVPNAFGRGAFRALNEPGVELPAHESSGRYDAHISVMSADEIQGIGGPERITERGKEFSYSLGTIREFDPEGWPEMEKCWVIDVDSPDLEKLRKSYGLDPQLKGRKFHITVAVRRKKVLSNNSVSKGQETPRPKATSEPVDEEYGSRLVRMAKAASTMVRYGMHKDAAGLGDTAEPLLQYLAQTIFGGKAGPLFPGRNALDLQQDQDFANLQNIVSRSMTAGDPTPDDIVRGLYGFLHGKNVPASGPTAEQLKNGRWAYDTLGPFLAKQFPKLYDQLHGSSGSVALFADGILQAHRWQGNPITAEQAVQRAKYLDSVLKKNPDLRRGYGGYDLGQIYQQVFKNNPGALSWDNPNYLVSNFVSSVGAVSAARDLARNQLGQDLPIPQLMEIVNAEAVNNRKSLKDTEISLRMRSRFAQQGGELQNAINQSGLSMSGTGVTASELQQQHEKLKAQARGSFVGNMVGATVRGLQSGAIAQGSPAHQYLLSTASGQMPVLSATQWAQLMAQSGVSAHNAMRMLYQESSNINALQPHDSLITGIRIGQQKYDHARYFNRINQMYPGNDPTARELRRGAMERQVGKWGYKNLENYMALQDPRVMTEWYNDVQRARNYAGGAIKASPLNQSNIVQRIVDEWKRGANSPHPSTPMTVLGAGFNIQRPQEPLPTPDLAKMPTQDEIPSFMPYGMAPQVESTEFAPEDITGTNFMGPRSEVQFGTGTGQSWEPPATMEPSTSGGRFADAMRPLRARGPGTYSQIKRTMRVNKLMGRRLGGPAVNPFSFEPKVASAKVIGIPDRSDYGDLSKLTPREIIDLVIQRHNAVRAKEHFDYRVGSPETGLYSWSTKPPTLPEPGERKFMRQQPLHSWLYGKFQGTIPGGYGAGTVKREATGRLLITKASPDKIEFTTAHSGRPERFILFRPKAWKNTDWLLMNVTPTKPIPFEKTHYKAIPAEEVDSAIDKMRTGTSYSAKIDGALGLIRLIKGHVEVFSYRKSKEGYPIFHTERFFGDRPKVDYPKELEGTTLTGELYGYNPSTDTVSQPQETGGLLNASIEKSLKNQHDRGVELRSMIFDIVQQGKKKIDQGTVPYPERRQMVESVLQQIRMPQFHIADSVSGPAEAKILWDQIASGQHSKTREGMVITPPTGNPLKAKLFDESNVYIMDVFPGKGKYAGRAAGGFSYALEPNGEIIGEVGSGLSDEFREQLWSNPDQFKGRIARIKSQGTFPSGAHRTPIFIALHEG